MRIIHTKLAFGAVSVGTACVIPELGMVKSRSGNSKATIYTAECMALVDAMHFALENRHHDVNIFTDSLSAVQALAAAHYGRNTNHLIFEILQCNARFYQDNEAGTRVTIYWIPAHVGIAGNELADKTAKEATDREPQILALPYSDLKPLFKGQSFLDNSNQIKEEGALKGRVYFERIYKPSTKPWFSGLNLSREQIVFISRCRSNHLSLRESLFKINVVDSPMCECGHDFQDLNHVLWQCPLGEEHRGALIKDLIKIRQYPPYDVTSFLCQLNITVMNLLYSYLKKCEIKI